MKQISLIMIALLAMMVTSAQDARLQAGDLNKALGNWTGKLTYLDYTKKKEVSIPSNCRVTLLKDGQMLKMEYIYPSESDYNGTDKLSISQDGRMVEDAYVRERVIEADGTLRFVLEEEGMDDRKRAVIRRIVRIQDNRFQITKMVKFSEGGDFFQRNQYEWTR